MRKIKVSVKKVEKNPFKVGEKCYLEKRKIDYLKKSISISGLLPGILVRENPNKKGYYQIVYGHHRFYSAVDLGYKEIELDLLEDGENSDFDIVKKFTLENMESGRTPGVIKDTVLTTLNFLSQELNKFKSVKDFLKSDLSKQIGVDSEEDFLLLKKENKLIGDFIYHSLISNGESYSLKEFPGKDNNLNKIKIDSDIKKSVNDFRKVKMGFKSSHINSFLQGTWASRSIEDAFQMMNHPLVHPDTIQSFQSYGYYLDFRCQISYFCITNPKEQIRLAKEIEKLFQAMEKKSNDNYEYSEKEKKYIMHPIVGDAQLSKREIVKNVIAQSIGKKPFKNKSKDTSSKSNNDDYSSKIDIDRAIAYFEINMHNVASHFVQMSPSIKDLTPEQKQRILSAISKGFIKISSVYESDWPKLVDYKNKRLLA